MIVIQQTKSLLISIGSLRGYRDLFSNRGVDSRNLRLATANTPGYYSHLAKVRLRMIS